MLNSMFLRTLNGYKKKFCQRIFVIFEFKIKRRNKIVCSPSQKSFTKFQKLHFPPRSESNTRRWEISAKATTTTTSDQTPLRPPRQSNLRLGDSPAFWHERCRHDTPEVIWRAQKKKIKKKRRQRLNPFRVSSRFPPPLFRNPVRLFVRRSSSVVVYSSRSRDKMHLLPRVTHTRWRTITEKSLWKMGFFRDRVSSAN